MTAGPAQPQVQQITLHGKRVAYRAAGDEGPVVILIHGMASSSSSWDPVLPLLAEHCRVIAPDLLGSGGSDKPVTGDYSLGAYASNVRDVMTALDIDRATIVGHSLGGGVALQFAYQFPERCDRLVLVNAGGLGREVHAILRAATLPGFDLVLRAVTAPWARQAGGTAGRLLRRVGIVPGTDMDQAGTALSALGDRETRAAFVKTIRSVIATGGQRVSANDRFYLAAAMPTLLVWGENDRIIPVGHATAAHEQIPGSHLEIIAGAGHYPHRDEPRRFSDKVTTFIAETEVADVSPERWRALLMADVASRAEALQAQAAAADTAALREQAP